MDGAPITLTRAQEQDGGGTALLWVLVWSELVAFGLLFGAFLVTGIVQQDAFVQARTHLNMSLAGLNTMVLLTSGYFAALAARGGASSCQTRGALIAAALFGGLFTAIKLFEYAGEIVVAGDERFGSFFELYFLITGFHLVHVVFGSVVLLLVAIKVNRSNVLLITTLWHVIDLIWVLMFPLIYIA